MTARTAKIVTRRVIVLTMVGFATSAILTITVLPNKDPGRIERG